MLFLELFFNGGLTANEYITSKSLPRILDRSVFPTTICLAKPINGLFYFIYDHFLIIPENLAPPPWKCPLDNSISVKI